MSYMTFLFFFSFFYFLVLNILILVYFMMGFQGGSVVKNLSMQETLETQRVRFDLWVRKIPWKRNGNPLRYSSLGNPMSRGVWRVHRVVKSWT